MRMFILSLKSGRRKCGPIGLAISIAVILAGAATAQVVDTGTSVEACISCHATGTLVPVSNIANVFDAHYVDLDPAGPETDSSYRQLRIDVTSVDLTGNTAVMDFDVRDEDDVPVDNIFDSDGRFVLSRLSLGLMTGDPTEWQNLTGGPGGFGGASERFTTTGGLFEALGGGSYRYTSVFDPTAIPVAQGDTLRLAIQISAGDIPAGNGWCDFDADLSAANDCVSPVSVTRDIVPTDSCNSCHGVTSDTQLSFHGGGRTEVEYCVTCHNPTIGRTDMTNMVHKIHFGNNLTDPVGWESYADVGYTRDVDDCLSCHGGGGVDADNWNLEPNRVSCGSCHDDVDFDTGEGHDVPGAEAQPTNRFCRNCHPSTGTPTDSLKPVQEVHEGVARSEEAASYRTPGDGFSIDDLSYDRNAEELTIDYSVSYAGSKQILQSDPRWTNGGRLILQIGWSTEEYTNEGSGSSPAPAQPVSVDALDIGGAVQDLGGGSYRAVVDVSSFGFGTLTVGMEGRPVVDILNDGSFSRVAVKSVFADVSVELRAPAEARRAVVDIAKCNACHDESGAGLSFHGTNRTAEPTVCAVCHNPDATDLRQRPADPGMTPDGKREESVDMKRMIHGIHAGEDLEQGLVIYGFGGSAHDYSGIRFTGNIANCETCHFPGTYSTDAAANTLPSTVDTGTDVTDWSDDLNISPVTAVCSSCHDGLVARNHMLLNGGSFQALDGNIVVPEPAFWATLAAGVGGIGLLARRRRVRAK